MYQFLTAFYENYKEIFGYTWMLPVLGAFIIWFFVTDVRTMHPDRRIIYAFAAARVIMIFYYPIRLTHVIGFVGGFLIFLIPAMLLKVPMGADIRFAAVLGFYIGIRGALAAFALAVIFYTVNYAARMVQWNNVRQKAHAGGAGEAVNEFLKNQNVSVPMGPFFAGGTAILVILYFISEAVI